MEYNKNRKFVRLKTEGGQAMRQYSCCFTGHRALSAADSAALEPALRSEIRRLYESGVTEFYAGGARGFDMLAEKTVLALKKELPIRLHLMLPCPQQAERWPQHLRREYEDILKQADSVHYVSDEYDASCMHRRNDAMVERSAYCICYLQWERGGTAYTVKRARRAGCTVIHLLTVEPEQLTIETAVEK